MSVIITPAHIFTLKEAVDTLGKLFDHCVNEGVLSKGEPLQSEVASAIRKLDAHVHLLAGTEIRIKG
jgi:hypothetical protein